ncbi:hypothetical protein Hypma_013718 [Hypsizygus marmoreus]|uniref:Uncharacterized protein n=1 Tax=Hypsizygus marmoreus TaxID=39966 RepID=A0A369JFP1_HYPMA|nr:hypothetical protein Hypma_013718 [Hypsizygus marmoreus]
MAVAPSSLFSNHTHLFHHLLAPCTGQKVVIEQDSVILLEAARSYGARKPDFKAREIKFDASSKLFDVLISEDRRHVSVPLTVRAVLWICTFPRDRSWTHQELLLEVMAAAVEQSCAVVGNQGTSFKTVRNDNMQTPMDFAIVTGWQVVMKSVFPAAIDGVLLKLFHLSNGFHKCR